MSYGTDAYSYGMRESKELVRRNVMVEMSFICVTYILIVLCI